MESLFSVEEISPKKGRGVIAKRFIQSGTLIDTAHVLLLCQADYDLIEKTLLYGYIFAWEECNGQPQYALAMSSSEFINHSYMPNAKYLQYYDSKTINFIAIRDILPGEEITINYNGTHIDQNAPVWFEMED